MLHTAAAAPAIGATLAMLSLGCPHDSPPPPPPPPWVPPPATVVAPPPDAPADDGGNACREQVAGLQDWLRAVEDSGLPLALSLLDDGARLVEREGTAIVDPAPLVHVSATKVFLDGVKVDAAEGLRTELTELIELRRSMMPESPFIKSPRCYLAIDGDVPWSRLVDMLAAESASGVERVTFVFRDPTRSVPAPPVSPIDRELERMSKSAELRRGQIAAELTAYVYQDCPEALKVIANMGVNPVADFKQVILDELPTAIGHCGCAPDDASVKALHWALFGNPRPTSGVTVRITDPQTSPASTLELDAARSWADAHEEVVKLAADATRQPARFAVLPEPDAK